MGSRGPDTIDGGLGTSDAIEPPNLIVCKLIDPVALIDVELRGNQILFGDEGNDLLEGGRDNDGLLGGTGRNDLNGKVGDDCLDLRGGDENEVQE